ncbi:MAG TPA: hypothetical protein VGO36_03930 [Solirubrobacterales bacterium]|jgi:DNA-binding response OmpR family regulator|nr:hypothetical protein [Solirubrobacterales bacterium]
MKGAILIVEDEQAIADLVRAYLRREGFAAVWAVENLPDRGAPFTVRLPA